MLNIRSYSDLKLFTGLIMDAFNIKILMVMIAIKNTSNGPRM